MLAVHTALQQLITGAGVLPPERPALAASPARRAPVLEVAGMTSRPWASATFVGCVHSVRLRWRSDRHELAEALRAIHQVIERLEQAELERAGHVLIEVTLAETRTSLCSDTGAFTLEAELELLTIED